MPRDFAAARHDAEISDGQIWTPSKRSAQAVLSTINPASWEGKEAPLREWRVNDWVPLRQATLLTGRGGVGKSLLTQMLFTCTALGMPFLGVNTRQCPSLYVTCEDDADELWRRQGAICASLGVGMQALDGKLFLAALSGEAGNAIATFDATGRLLPTDRWQQIEATVESHGIGFVGLDNASHLMGGDHNDLNQVAAFLNLLNGLALKSDGAVLLLHHPNKAGDDWLGSVAWENQVRSRLIMKPSDEEGDTDSRSLQNPKANYAPMGSRIDFRWHKGAFVRDSDLPSDIGDELAATVKANAENAAFLRCLAERNKQRRQVSEKPTAQNYAPKQFEKMPEARGINRKRLEAAMDRLFRIDAIERGFIYRDTGEGKDVYGLKLRDSGKPETSPESYRKHIPESSGNPQKTTENTPPISKDIPGAATQAAAPSPIEIAKPWAERSPDDPDDVEL